MVTENTLNRYGLIKDEKNLMFKKVFKNNAILKEVHIDIYSKNPLVSSFDPFMLLLRNIEKKVVITNKDDRLIIKKNIDNYETYLMSVLFSKITECYCKTSDYYSEFILNIQNIYYKITVFN